LKVENEAKRNADAPGNNRSRTGSGLPQSASRLQVDNFPNYTTRKSKPRQCAGSISSIYGRPRSDTTGRKNRSSAIGLRGKISIANACKRPINRSIAQTYSQKANSFRGTKSTPNIIS
jgi:hypothetical protein